MRNKTNSFGDSPVEVQRKAGPRGNGDWPGFDAVYTKISEAAGNMGRTRHAHLSEEHIDTMADLGSGHEERMKARLVWLHTYGWVK